MQSSGPYSIQLDQTLSLQPPSGSVKFVTVVLSNASPFACQVTIGGAAAPWLQPYTAAQYSLPQGGYPQVTAETNPGPGNISSGQITADWYLADDPLLGTYPAPLINQAVQAAIAGSVQVVQTTAASLNALTVGGIPASTFGTGADGAATISANTTLSRDMNYTDLTVNAGVTLHTNGYIVRCTGTLTNNGTIDNSANGLTPGATGTLAGGAPGPNAPNSGSAAGLSPASATIEGGAGGYIGGTTSAPITSSYQLVQGASMSGGASGGASQDSTGGATGGAGGGVVLVAAATVTGTGTISANGGNGAASSIAPNNFAGGGGGGVIAVLAHNLNGQTYSVAAGIGSQNGGTDTALNGKPGQVLVYVA